MNRLAAILAWLSLACHDAREPSPQLPPAPPATAPSPALSSARPTPASPPVPTVPTPWTIAVYMAADNDLETEALSDLEEMLTASHPGLRFVVQLDRPGQSPFSLPKLPAWTGAQRFVIADRKLSPAGLLGPIDTATPAPLADFVSFAAQHAGSDRLALVLWGHGHGSLGLADDDTSGLRLSPRDLGEALRLGLTRAGVARADLVAFDACSMADLGVATLVAPSARWMFASQHRTPGAGWSYRVLRDFVRPERDSTFDLVDLVAHELRTSYSALDAPPAWSLLDLDRIAAPRNALLALAASPHRDELCAALPPPSPNLAEESMEDMDTLAARVALQPSLAALAVDLRRAATSTVSQRWTDGDTSTATGLSVLARSPGPATAGDPLAPWWARLQECHDSP